MISNYAGQGWSGVMSLAFVPVYIHYLGIESYGLIGLFAILQGWLTLFDMGMTPTLNREMARFTAGAYDSKSIRDLLRTLEILCLIIAIAILIGIWLASDWLAAGWLQSVDLSKEVIAKSIAIIGWVSALRFIEGIYRGAILGLQKHVLLNILIAFFSTLRAVGAVGVLEWWSATIDSYFIWQGIVSVLTVLTFSILTHKSLPECQQKPRFSLESLSNVRRFAGGMMATTLLALLLTQVDKILLSRLLNLTEFGYYVLAGSIAGSLSMLIGPLAQSIYPAMSKLAAQNDEKNLISVYHNATQLLAVLLIPIVLTVCFYAQEIIYVWSGDQLLAKNTADILSVMIVGSLLNGIMSIPYMLQLAYGWSNFALKLNFIAVLILVPSIFYVVPKFGGLGSAWIWLLLNLGYITFSIHFMHMRILPKEKWRWYFSDLIAPSFGSIIALLLLWPMQPNVMTSRFTWLIFLVVSVILAIVISAALADRIRPRIIAAYRLLK